MAEDTEIDRCIEALQTIKLTRSFYASSPDAGRLTEEVIRMLGGVHNSYHYANVPIRTAVARAIHQAYLGPLPDDVGDQPRPSET